MLQKYSTDGELVISLGRYIADLSEASIADHGYFAISFSGGSAATKVCQAFECKEISKTINWSKWKIMFCDERYVELDNDDSNYKVIYDGLIRKHEEICDENVVKLNKLDSLEQASLNYEKQMRAIFKEVEFPSIDLLVLGMGPDGHICSLFPYHPILKKNSGWVSCLSDSPKPPPERITLTLNVINNACNVAFVVTGESKAVVLQRVLEGEATEEYPASLVRSKNVEWFVDHSAAKLLH